jgi:hypothetical protein
MIHASRFRRASGTERGYTFVGARPAHQVVRAADSLLLAVLLAAFAILLSGPVAHAQTPPTADPSPPPAAPPPPPPPPAAAPPSAPSLTGGSPILRRRFRMPSTLPPPPPVTFPPGAAPATPPAVAPIAPPAAAPVTPPAVQPPAPAPALPGPIAIPKRVIRRRKPKPPEEAPRFPPADVVLSIEAPTARGPWVLRIMNNGDVPARIVADARLLSLDVTPPSAAKARHCEMPEDMRPNDPLERSLVVPPKRAYAETFEPRLYCFDGKNLDALSSGSIVVAHLGPLRAGEPSFVAASAIDGVMPQVSDRRVLESPAIRLPDEAPKAATTPADITSDAAALSLTAPEMVDAVTTDLIEIPLTLRNGGSRPLVVRFRPELLRFDLVRASVEEHCAWPALPATPLAESFTTLRAKGGVAELTADLDAYCKDHALNDNGLIEVWAKLDTRAGSGQGIGIRSFDGQVVANSPTFVRLHHGRRPRPLTLPQLEGP